ncbi:ATP-binding protein [Actinocrinis puniceicyclus]|uniref:ATP-binding protein n=1 Tax=Actinocrinis puniceicyclus TaxID=977794 RepID=A0A8J8B9B9_9ACTN|nr:ATP-binding protein [Actinocrinis puniceicyclus]MBS2961672.1 ATP-binding protein [Actinocrinis puniceicyclus]
MELSPRRLARLNPETTAPRRARDLVAEACAAWHREPLAELAQLVISELVSNAVLHSDAGTAIEVELRVDADRLLLRVHDDGGGMPQVVPTARRTVGGVGLDLVSRVAQSWGVTPDMHGGKDVWCVLAPPAQHTATWYLS